MAVDFREGAGHEVFPGFTGRFVHSATMTLAYWHARAGATVPPHSHHHEQIVHVLEGEFEFTVGGETERLVAGSVVIVPPNVVHSGRTLTACRIVDAFHPVREDYRFE